HDLLHCPSPPRPRLHGRIVGHHTHGAALHPADPGDDPIGGQIVSHRIREEAVLHERVLVTQQPDPIPPQQTLLASQLLRPLVEVAGPGSLRALLEIVHRVPYSERRRTRSLMGTAPNPNPSRSFRSR